MNYKIDIANIYDLEGLFNIQRNYDHLLISYDSLKNDLESESKKYFVVRNNQSEIISAIGISLLVDHADIDMIITKKEYSKQGLATSLIQYIIKYCKSINIYEIFLEVRTSNKAAISLYEQTGFKSISIRKNYYSDNNEDALIYLLKL